MNGPFELRDWGAVVNDADCNPVAEGRDPNGYDEEIERKNAQMICDALNAVYYAARAAASLQETK